MNLWRKYHQMRSLSMAPYCREKTERQAPRSRAAQPTGMTWKSGVINMTNIDKLCFTAIILKATWHTVHIWQISDCLESNITDNGRSHSIHICLPWKSACDCLFHKKCDSSGIFKILHKNNLFYIKPSTSGFEEDKCILIFWTDFSGFRFWPAIFGKYHLWNLNFANAAQL